MDKQRGKNLTAEKSHFPTPLTLLTHLSICQTARFADVVVPYWLTVPLTTFDSHHPDTWLEFKMKSIFLGCRPNLWPGFFSLIL
jgi:hypothetical protein